MGKQQKRLRVDATAYESKGPALRAVQKAKLASGKKWDDFVAAFTHFKGNTINSWTNGASICPDEFIATLMHHFGFETVQDMCSDNPKTTSLRVPTDDIKK